MLFSKRERTIRRIVIVEDEPLVAFDTERVLADSGYEVVATINSLIDATRVISEERLDLVLSDIWLGGRSEGMEVARVAAARGVPVLFVSADFPAEARGLGLGCLAKPYSDRMLKAALDALDARLQGRKVRKLPPGVRLYDILPSAGARA